MLLSDAVLIAQYSDGYGEPDTAEWALVSSDDELLRICSVADWLLLHGPRGPRGGSMRVDRALALAAVYVREGAPRDLARRTFRTAGDFAGEPSRRLSFRAAQDVGLLYGLDDTARAFWQRP